MNIDGAIDLSSELRAIVAANRICANVLINLLIDLVS